MSASLLRRFFSGEGGRLDDADDIERLAGSSPAILIDDTSKRSGWRNLRLPSDLSTISLRRSLSMLSATDASSPVSLS